MNVCSKSILAYVIRYISQRFKVVAVPLMIIQNA